MKSYGQGQAGGILLPNLRKALNVVSNRGNCPKFLKIPQVSKDQKQIEKELAILENNNAIIDALIRHYASYYSGNVKRREIFDALFILLSEKEKLEWPGDLWNIELEYVEVIKLLEAFDFSIVLNKFQTFDIIFPDGLLLEYKVRIKSKGLIWIIHKYDADPFPSNPHAHQIQNNIKLDLSNGNCYQARKYIYTIKKKDLLLIRKSAAKVFQGELPTLSIQ